MKRWLVYSIRLLFCFSCLMFLGCSFIDTTVYPTHKDAVVMTSKKFSHKPIYLEVQDQTGHKNRGVKKNELGMESASIYTQPDIKEIMKKALEVELRAAGFEVFPGKGDDYPQLNVNLQECFVEPDVKLFSARICAAVEADMILIFPGEQVIHQRKFKGMSNIYTPFYWYSALPLEVNSLYKASLEIAMTDFLKKSVPAICEALQ